MAAVPIIMAHIREEEEAENRLPWQPQQEESEESEEHDYFAHDHASTSETYAAPAQLGQVAKEEDMARLIWAAGIIKRFFRYRYLHHPKIGSTFKSLV